MDESPRCVYCDHQVGVEDDCLAVLMGTFKKSPRHGGFFFEPMPYPDGRPAMWIHWYCMEVMGFDFSDANSDDKTGCTFCPEELVGEETCFELELGHFTIHGPDTVWIGDRSHLGQVQSRALTYACWECIEQGMGEGNDIRFREMIGLPPPNADELEQEYCLMQSVTKPKAAPKRMGKKRIPRRAVG